MVKWRTDKHYCYCYSHQPSRICTTVSSVYQIHVGTHHKNKRKPITARRCYSFNKHKLACSSSGISAVGGVCDILHKLTRFTPKPLSMALTSRYSTVGGRVSTSWQIETSTVITRYWCLGVMMKFLKCLFTDYRSKTGSSPAYIPLKQHCEKDTEQTFSRASVAQLL